MKRYLPLIVLVVIGVALAAVLLSRDNNKPKSNTNTTTNTATQSTPTKTNQGSSSSTDINSPANAKEVSIIDFKFTPENITVKKGTTVTWTNNDSTPHTVSKDSTSGPESETLNNGDTFSFTFNEVGTFGYHCNIHQDMHGTVKVTE